MNYNFKTNCDSNNNCNSNAKNSSEIDLDNLTFEFISEINDKLYEDLSNIANICNKFDNVKNTFFIDNEDCETTIDNETNENIKDNNTLEDDYSKVIIAKKDKTIVGFISIYLIDESTAEICGFVLPEYRNNNIGNYLMEKLSYEMEDFYISIPVAKDNKTAPNFLRTNGYYPSTTECSMVINTDNIVEKPSSFDCSIDFKKTENEDEIIFEIFKDNNNIGSCFVSIFETCGCIHNVEINEAFRGNGYSKLLLQYSLYDIKNICQNIILHVTKENVPAYNLYTKLNFITTSEIIYYDNL